MATASVATSTDGFSTGFLLFSTGSALIAGISLGFVAAKRALRAELGGRPSSRHDSKVPRLNNLASFTRSISTDDSNMSSGMTTPSETPRPGSSNSEALTGLNGDVRMAVIVRQDVPLAANKVVQHAAWTVLGMFKKLYKRRDPGWKLWEVTGEKLEVLLASSEDELMAVQAAARAAGLPTHTFAGRDRSRKQRTVMAVGPTDVDTLTQLVGHLKQLLSLV